MKNIVGITLASLFLFTMPFSVIKAQEKKSEQKIRIITNDGSGEKVVIDTVFSGESPESLKLKDGSTVYIKHGSEDEDLIHADGAHHIFVTSSSDGKDGNKTSEITIIQSDSISAGKGDVIFYSSAGSGDSKGDVHYKVVSKNTKNEQGSDKFMSVDKVDSSSDKSRYIIAKDGMVITIEGSDEAKTKALAKEIEEMAGVKSEEEVK
jgi:hypothetical protein